MASKKNEPTLTLEGVSTIAMIDAVIEALEEMRVRSLSEIEADIFGPFWDEVHNDGVHELRSFAVKDAADPAITGRAAFTRKKSNSAVSQNDRRTLTEAKISLPAPKGAKFEVNKDYASNDKVLLKISQVLAEASVHDQDIPPDFIVNRDQIIAIDEKTVMDVLALDFQTAYRMLPILGTVNINKTALSPKITIDKAMRAILPKVKDHMKEAST